MTRIIIDGSRQRIEGSRLRHYTRLARSTGRSPRLKLVERSRKRTPAAGRLSAFTRIARAGEG